MLFVLHTRLRVLSAPGFPCALSRIGGTLIVSTRAARAAGTRNCALRECVIARSVSDEAIQTISGVRTLDCFASLAMTTGCLTIESEKLLAVTSRPLAPLGVGAFLR